MRLEIYKLTELSTSFLSGDFAFLGTGAFLARGGGSGGGDSTSDAALLRGGGFFCT